MVESGMKLVSLSIDREEWIKKDGEVWKREHVENGEWGEWTLTFYKDFPFVLQRGERDDARLPN
jgi:hypothetical protein